MPVTLANVADPTRRRSQSAVNAAIANGTHLKHAAADRHDVGKTISTEKCERAGAGLRDYKPAARNSTRYAQDTRSPDCPRLVRGQGDRQTGIKGNRPAPPLATVTPPDPMLGSNYSTMKRRKPDNWN